jgi:CDP-glycerol glycerophosphotransferase (TagB/SpsB family)
MFVNPDRRNRYVEAGLVPDDPSRAPLVGYPKVDCLVDGSLDTAAIRQELRLDPRIPTVMYAPTWSPHSSLNAMGEEIIDRLASAGLQVIVKLHDRSYDRRERGSGGIDWARRLSRYRHHPLVRVVRQPDGCPSMAVSDAMVSDHSSIAFEYLLLDRPLIVIDRPDLIIHARINPEKVKRLRDAADVVDTADAMISSLGEALRRPNRLSVQRRRVATDLFHAPGTATERALAHLYGLIDLPAPKMMHSTVGSGTQLVRVG